ncbi:hypothetical protein AA313_de0201654 [Arthrobotrys entomopaga]|nr:hypothetical protein AA313_de0201654 [Arthrobotrys entomopaga]
MVSSDLGVIIPQLELSDDIFASSCSASLSESDCSVSSSSRLVIGRSTDPPSNNFRAPGIVISAFLSLSQIILAIDCLSNANSPLHPPLSRWSTIPLTFLKVLKQPSLIQR